MNRWTRCDHANIPAAVCVCVWHHDQRLAWRMDGYVSFHKGPFRLFPIDSLTLHTQKMLKRLTTKCLLWMPHRAKTGTHKLIPGALWCRTWQDQQFYCQHFCLRFVLCEILVEFHQTSRSSKVSAGTLFMQRAWSQGLYNVCVGIGDFPFMYTQLAPYRGAAISVIRLAQVRRGFTKKFVWYSFSPWIRCGP